MNIKEPEISSFVIYRYIHFPRKKLIFFFFPFLVLENFQIRLVFILTTALFFFHSTYHLLTYYVIYLFIMFTVLYLFSRV